MLTALVLSLALAASPKELAGTWSAGGETFMTLSANGTGAMDGDMVKWSADGRTLTFTDADGEVEKVQYTLQGDQLTLSMGGIAVPLTRGGKAGKKLAAAAKAPRGDDADAEALAQAQQWLMQQQQLQVQGQGGQQQPAQRGGAMPQARGAGNDQLSQLLLSSAWCNFQYNQRTGASSQTRVQYYANGTWSLNGRNETYNSGSNGTVAGQYDNGGSGQWQVVQGVLHLSYPPQYPQLTPVPGFSVTRNSNGYPIINGNGKEWSMCN